MVLRKRQFSSLLWIMLALTALRLTRSWNQTGQKFAGEPDIVKIFLLEYPQSLWLLVGAMYLVVFVHIIPNLQPLPLVAVTAATSVLVTSAFAFKLAFTGEDAPELVVGVAKMLHDTFQGQSLLLRARIVFGIISALVVVGVYHAMTGGPKAARSSG